MSEKASCAFNGEAALKQSLLSELERNVVERRVYPCPKLIWQPELQARSVSASMIESADQVEFEARTGIPVGLALLHESILYSSGKLQEEDGQLRFTGPDGIAGLSLDWLRAIRPGADLTHVIPHFALWKLADLQRPDSAFSQVLNNSVRCTCTRLHMAYEQELGQGSVEPSEWKVIRRVALQATNSATDPWNFAAANFIESIAWPPQDIAGEFKDIFFSLFTTLVSYGERTALTVEQRENQEAVLMQIARHVRGGAADANDGSADFVLQRANAAMRDPAEQERLQHAKKRAEPVTKALALRNMEALIKLVAAA